MFIALLVMVALSLAGIALIRSADTATVVAGNLAFKQAAVFRGRPQHRTGRPGAVRSRSRSRGAGPGDRRQDSGPPGAELLRLRAGRRGGLPARQRPDPGDSDGADDRTVRRRRPQRCAVDSRRCRRQQELLRDRAHVRQRRSRGGQQLQSLALPRWAQTPERSTTGPRSSRRRVSIASPFASRAPAIRWPMRRRFCNSPRASQVSQEQPHDMSRPSAFRRYCAAVVAAALVLQPLAAYAAPITAAISPKRRCRASIPSSRTSCSRSTTPAAWRRKTCLITSVRSSDRSLPHLSHCSRQCGGWALRRIANPTCSWRHPRLDPPLRSSDYNTHILRPAALTSRQGHADRTNLPCEGTARPARARGPAVYIDGSPAIRGNTGTTIDSSTAIRTRSGARRDARRAADFATGLTPTARSAAATAAVSGLHDPAADHRHCPPSPRATTTRTSTTPRPTAAPRALRQRKFVFNFPLTLYGNPYYYTISQVQYCSTQDSRTARATSDLRSPMGSTTYKYVRYGTGAATFDPQAFTRVDIKATGILVNGVPAANPSGRTYAQEMSNFAKWYAFYRTRMLAMKTAGGLRVLGAEREERARRLPHAPRTTPPLTFLNVTPFNAANKATWFSHLYARDSERAARHCRTPHGASANTSRTPAAPGCPGVDLTRADPPRPGNASRTTTCCRPTGTGTVFSITRRVGDQDLNGARPCPGPSPASRPGARSRGPFVEGTTATSNTLADLAMRYWIRDIRPGVADKVQDTIAPWQHVTLYGLSIGAQGASRIQAASMTSLPAPRIGHAHPVRRADLRSGPEQSTISGTRPSTAAASISMPRPRRISLRASSRR